MGAWIEIGACAHNGTAKRVAPYMGAWIEINIACGFSVGWLVAPYMGAWIEIIKSHLTTPLKMSLPTWERGLKLATVMDVVGTLGRSLHGSVD